MTPSDRCAPTTNQTLPGDPATRSNARITGSSPFALADTFGDPCAMYDASGRLLSANAAFRRVFGEASPITTARWRHLWESIKSAGNAQTEVEAPPSAAPARFFEARAVLAPTDSEDETVAVIFRDNSVLHAEREQTARYMASMLENQTRLRDQALELEEANQLAEEASKEKSRFLANMSHEIRTPLNGVIGMMTLLERSRLDAGQARFARLARVSAQSLKALVDDILDYSKLEANRVELERIAFSPAEAVEAVCSTVEMLADESGITLEYAIHPSTPQTVVGDPTRLRQILLNLVNNAVKFTPSGGVIVRCVLDSETDDEATLRFSVTDTGVGIAKDRIDRLFSPFSQADESTTRRFGGTGLGLAICRDLITIMGGEIGVSSEEGEGSTFWFTVPLGKSKADADRPASAGPSNHLDLFGRIAVRPDDTDETPSLAARLNELGLLCDSDPDDPANATPIGLLITQADAKPDSPIPAKITIIRDQDAADAELDPVTATATVPAAWGAEAIVAIAAELGASLRSSIEPITAPEPDQDNAHQAAADLAGMRILLAEDMDINREVIKGLLANTGCEIDIAVNGEQAADKAEATRYDAILMDCQMPVMDGYQATAAIRNNPNARSQHTQIIAITANAMSGDESKCLGAGMDAYVAKPVEAKALLRALKNAKRKAAPHPKTDRATDAAKTQAESPRDTRNQTMTPTPDHTDGPVFRLESLLERCLFRADLVTTLISRFAEQLPERIAELEAAKASANTEQIRSISHALKGSAGNLSAETLRAAAAAAEDAIRTAGDKPPLTDEIATLTDAVIAAVHTVHAAIPPLLESGEIERVAHTLDTEEEAA